MRPFESRTQEEVARQRLEKVKQLAMWPTKDMMQRYIADAGATASACLEKMEDVNLLLQELGLEGVRRAAATPMVAVLREHHNAVRQFFTKIRSGQQTWPRSNGGCFLSSEHRPKPKQRAGEGTHKATERKQEDRGGKWKGKQVLHIWYRRQCKWRQQRQPAG